MTTNSTEIESFIKRLLRHSAIRKSGLTEVEQLVVASIVQETTYRQASIEYKYTESSFQNAASRLFKDLSLILGTPINRRNFLDLIKKEQFNGSKAGSEGEIAFDRLQANIWIRSNRAKLVSMSYKAQQILDLTEYLVQYSPQYEATFCLEVGDKSSPLEILWGLCHTLQIALPTPRNDVQALLRSIGLALKKRSTLLVMRFDKSPLGVEKSLHGNYIDTLMTLGLLENTGCLLVLDSDSMENEAELKRSLSYQLRRAIESRAASLGKGKAKMRLIAIENDHQVICDILRIYLR
jgi:hypothetical protein